ncbi:hypothetical protein AB0D84_21695 [Streptomyces sp. NPDC048193]|uniref:hypothetical protein n=1 Tax=unclassified Streptomyces TaxID=2593676 RepID=UPI003428F164
MRRQELTGDECLRTAGLRYDGVCARPLSERIRCRDVGELRSRGAAGAVDDAGRTVTRR